MDNRIADEPALPGKLPDVEVVVFRDGRFWIAQAINVDYCSHGDTQELARRNFLLGFETTLLDHLRHFGDLSRVLVPPPESITEQLLAALATARGAPVEHAVAHLPAPVGDADINFQQLPIAA